MLGHFLKFLYHIFDEINKIYKFLLCIYFFIIYWQNRLCFSCETGPDKRWNDELPPLPGRGYIYFLIFDRLTLVVIWSMFELESRRHGGPDGAAPIETRATTIYERLKADILSARLAPGEKLSMRFLLETYDVGQTPLREALNRLATENLAVGRDQRGFIVKPVSQDELLELTRTRVWVETLALREAMANGSQEWEEALLVAHHRMEKINRSLSPEVFVDNPKWEQPHRDFHTQLIMPCKSKPLVHFCNQLAEYLYRYRMISLKKSFQSRNVKAEHALILQAVIDRNTEEAVYQLQRHFEKTAEFIMDSFVPDKMEGARASP